MPRSRCWRASREGPRLSRGDEPLADEQGHVAEGEGGGVEAGVGAHSWEGGGETGVVFLDYGSAGERADFGGKPVANFGDGVVGVGSVGVDVLACDVGEEVAVAVGLAVEDQNGFLALGGAAVAFAPQEQAEFKGHVEAGQIDGGV